MNVALPRYNPKQKAIPVMDAIPVADHSVATRSTWTPPADRGYQHFSDIPQSVGASSNAETARTIVANGRTAVFAFLARDKTPVAFVAPYAVTEAGTILLGVRPGVATAYAEWLSSGTEVSVVVTDTPLTSSASNDCGGVTIVGALSSLATETAFDEALARYAGSQPADAVHLKRGEGSLYAVEPTSVLMTVEEGDLVDVALDEYSKANSDPLASLGPTLVAHLGNDQGSLLLLCRAYGAQPDASAAMLAGIDQYGLTLLATTRNGRETVRLPFSQAVSTPEEVRRELNAMAKGARFKLGTG